MKNLLLSTALILPLSGCGWIMDKSITEFILDDILGCDGVRNEWPCTAQYLGGGKGEFMGDHQDHDGVERNSNGHGGYGHGGSGEPEGDTGGEGMEGGD